jgi:hypothetical protein
MESVKNPIAEARNRLSDTNKVALDLSFFRRLPCENIWKDYWNQPRNAWPRNACPIKVNRKEDK